MGMTTATLRRSRVCVLGLIAVATLAACEQQAPPPPAGGGTATTGTAGSAGPGGPLGSLSSQPQSQLGRSAQAGVRAAQGLSDRHAEASAAARELSGEGQAIEVNGVKFVAPSSWERQQAAGSMRAAEFRALAPGMDPEIGTATLVVFTFPPGQGGNVQMNIDRWKGQFRDASGQAPEAEIGRRTIAGVPVTTVALEGTYSEMTPMGGQGPARAGWGFRGAIVETGQGTVVLRLTGPREAVKALQTDWAAMMDGMTR